MSAEGLHSEWVNALFSYYRGRTPRLPSTPAQTPPPAETVSRGTHSFGQPRLPVNLGETGITATVSDLTLSSDMTTALYRGRLYRFPSLTKSGLLTIQGTDSGEDIGVRQNASGDTVLDVFKNGERASLNAGKIAGLKIQGLGGEDRIAVNVTDYYGGVEVLGGEGQDTISGVLENAFKLGASIRGDSGDDAIALSETASAATIEGGDGNDRLSIESFNPGSELQRRLSGGAGDDLLWGGIGSDTLEGNNGADTLYAGAGNDQAFGGAGNDWIAGGSGNDLLLGDAGADLLLGGAGNDLVMGGCGDDQLYAGEGEDWLKGGAGMDALAPTANDPATLYFQERVGDHLRVNYRGVDRSQPVLPTFNEPPKRLLDYQPDEDALLLPRSVA